MNKNKIVIVIPMYKSTLEWYEKLSLERVVAVLGEYTIVVCCPDDFNLLPIEESYGINRTERFEKSYFKSVDDYNKLMTSCKFYERFMSFEYMLIYQLDAFVFHDKLEYFCSLGYDYIGAPWTRDCGTGRFKKQIYHLKVGNGGFSLRRIKACLEALKDNSDILSEWHANEDVFFAYCGYINPTKFRVAPGNVAMRFSFEFPVRKLYKKNNYTLPMGCHAWIKFGGEIYPQLFKEVDVNIENYSALLGKEDSEYIASRFKHRIYMNIMRMNSFSDILPNKNCWSIVCFGKIGKRLAEVFLAGGSIINAIYDSNLLDTQTDWNGIKLIRLEKIDDLQKEKGRIIIATTTHERELIEMFENNGLIYGLDFLSLCREYARKHKGLGYEKCLRYK